MLVTKVEWSLWNEGRKSSFEPSNVWVLLLSNHYGTSVISVLVSMWVRSRQYDTEYRITPEVQSVIHWSSKLYIVRESFPF